MAINPHVTSQFDKDGAFSQPYLALDFSCRGCHNEYGRGDKLTDKALQKSFQPESHVESNWISRHRFEFDSTCEGCHDVSDPGGISDASFCGNSACHATEWTYAGFNVPSIVELTNVLDSQLPTYLESNLIGTIWSVLSCRHAASPAMAARLGSTLTELYRHDDRRQLGTSHRAGRCRRESAD